jgi:hypothetical protein
VNSGTPFTCRIVQEQFEPGRPKYEAAAPRRESACPPAQRLMAINSRRKIYVTCEKLPQLIKLP